MKKLLLILTAALMAGVARADEKSEASLQALQQKIADWDAYSVEFSITMGDQTFTGAYRVSGESYHIATPWAEVFCDGHTKWEVSQADREIYVDHMNGGVFDILASEIASGRVVVVSEAGDMPIKIVYRAGEQEARIDIEKITNDVAFEPAVFEFDRARFPGFEVIDFR